MSGERVKASKMKVYQAPDGTSDLDERFYVYVFDVFNKVFLPGKVFDSIERATSFKRHEQERIYLEQEAEPELFDLPFISNDPDLIARVERDPTYRSRLESELGAEARNRVRRR